MEPTEEGSTTSTLPIDVIPDADVEVIDLGDDDSAPQVQTTSSAVEVNDMLQNKVAGVPEPEGAQVVPDGNQSGSPDVGTDSHSKPDHSGAGGQSSDDPDSPICVHVQSSRVPGEQAEPDVHLPVDSTLEHADSITALCTNGFQMDEIESEDDDEEEVQFLQAIRSVANMSDEDVVADVVKELVCEADREIVSVLGQR